MPSANPPAPFRSSGAAIFTSPNHAPVPDHLPTLIGKPTYVSIQSWSTLLATGLLTFSPPPCASQ